MKEIEILHQMDACPKAIRWLKTQSSYETAWRNCKRGDWMLWLLQKKVGIGIETDQQCNLWRARADCAELALPIWEKKFPQDGRVKDCIDAIRLYADKKIDITELHKIKKSADAAYADAAYAAAAYAAYAAAAAAADDDNDDDTAADNAAAAYADNAAAYAVARTEVFKKCADICRKYFPNAPILS